MEDTTKRGRGRPKKERSRNDRLNLRLNEDDSKMLDACTKATNESRSAVVRRAVRIYHNTIINRK